MKCGNCNLDFPNVKAMIAHEVIIHGSFFDESAHPEYAPHQKALRAKIATGTFADMQASLRGEY